jgi:exonuclease VII large subunit
LHFIAHEKEKKEKKLEQDRKKLEKLRGKLRNRLDDFLRGKRVEVNSLSKAFLSQAIVVDEEKKKLDFLRARLEAAKKQGFIKRSFGYSFKQ